MNKEVRAYAVEIRDSIKKKADKYKSWTRWTTFGIVIPGALIPIFANLPIDCWVLTKLTPSLLGVVVAVIPTFIGIEKPSERWKLYRRYHRMIDIEISSYDGKVGPYSAEKSDANLRSKIDDLQKILHQEWEGLIPDASEYVDKSKGS